jgi:hypothetical protein
LPDDLREQIVRQRLHDKGEAALDSVKRAALYIKMNDLVVQQRVVTNRLSPGCGGTEQQAAGSAGWLGQQLLGAAGLIHDGLA